MAVLLKSLLYYGNGGEDSPVELSNVKSVNIKLGKSAKQNDCEIILNNNFGDQLDNAGEIQFEVEDRIKVFLRYDTIGTAINADSTDDLILHTEVKEVGVVNDEKKNEMKLSCVDRTYTLLNRLWVQDYSGQNSPEIIQNVIRSVSDNSSKKPSELFTNTGALNGVYEIDARLKSAYPSDGFIEDTRPDGSVFPDVAIAKVFKPAYEWIEDLSTIQYTNTSDELGGLLPLQVGRSMQFYVDELNRFHWEYPTNTASIVMKVGTTTPISPDTEGYHIKSVKLTKKIFDNINFIIYNAGADMNGYSILGFVYDDTSGKPNVKDSYRPMVSVAKDMKEQDRKATTNPITKNTDESYNYPGSYPKTPAWNTAISVGSNDEYNDQFILEAKRRANSRSRAIIGARSKPRWKGTIELRGHKFTPGDLMAFTDSYNGITNQKLRITDVQHNIQKSGWFTTLSVDEDASELEYL